MSSDLSKTRDALLILSQNSHAMYGGDINRFQKCLQFFDKKLWYELSIEFAERLILDQKASSDAHSTQNLMNDFAQIFESLIYPLQSKLDQSLFVQFLAILLSQVKDLENLNKFDVLMKNIYEKTVEDNSDKQGISFLTQRALNINKNVQEARNKNDHIDITKTQQEDSNEDNTDITVELLYLKLTKVIAMVKHYPLLGLNCDFQQLRKLATQIRSDKNNFRMKFPFFLQIKYYHAISLYYQSIGNFEEYFHNSLALISLILSSKNAKNIYTKIEQCFFDQSTFHELCKNICLSALLSEKLFSYGEILSNPTSHYLRRTQHFWLVELIEAFNAGNIEAFDRFLSNNANNNNSLDDDQYQSKKLILDSQEVLCEKIRMMALLNIAAASRSKQITFDQIQKSCRIECNMVEMLLIKSASRGLIDVKINEIEKLVTITNVKPMILTSDQMLGFADLLEKWSHNMRGMQHNVSNNSATDNAVADDNDINDANGKQSIVQS